MRSKNTLRLNTAVVNIKHCFDATDGDFENAAKCRLLFCMSQQIYYWENRTLIVVWTLDSHARLGGFFIQIAKIAKKQVITDTM
jgi:hypothetical protein